VAKFRQNENDQQRFYQQRRGELEGQHRMAQYRYYQQYYDQEREQQVNFQNYDYNNDPYFYTASDYRYYRGGQYYETNQYGANMLREGVNYGYQQGFLAGQADRQDGWRPDFQDSFAYQDANYGYGGYYVSQNDYNYYFRQGFQRGYSDGYYGRSRYGRRVNGNYSILGAILGTILNMQSLQ